MKVKWKIFLYFSIFLAIMLVVLWLFQIVFLNSFYKFIKTNEIKKLANQIVQNIDNSNIQNIIDDICMDNYISTRIIDTTEQIPNYFKEIYSFEVAKTGRIVRMSNIDLYRCYIDAKEQGGTSMFFFQDDSSDIFVKDKEFDAYNHLPFSIFYFDDSSKFSSNNIIIFENKQPNDKYIYYNNFKGRVSIDNKDKAETLVYTIIFKNKENREIMLLMDSYINPVTSTVQTLTIQLIIITIVLILLALIISLIMSRKISTPIVNINKSAKVLAQGNYDVRFKGEGYREIAELTDTLNYAAEELSKVENLRRELIANISHDLRTPLTMIKGYSEMMIDIPGENNAQNAKMIMDEANRLTNLVTSLLDLSKLQSGVQSIEPSLYNLTQSIRDIFLRYSKIREQDGYNIEFYSDKDVFINADEVKINQVIYNLINNAINYAGEDKTVIVLQTVDNNYVTIKVIDHGEGIDQDKIKYIWDRYYKIDKNHKRAVIGTGLGLSIVKSILELHCAQYGVESKIDVGSTFWFKLPYEKIEDNP